MEVFRLTRLKYKDGLSGVGAALHGGRWNSKGVHIIYTSANRSLAMAEVLVHLSLGDLPSDYCMLTIYIPDHLSIQQISETELPADWHRYPPTQSTQFYGDQFIEANRYPILKVPSAVTLGDFNVLLNPQHEQYADIRILSSVSFPFSTRLLRNATM